VRQRQLAPADPDRFGPSVAVVVNDTPYIVDFGPGVVRRASAAKIMPEKLKIAFASHLHSDHTAGLPDLILTPAVLDRHAPLVLCGPTGIKSMADHILKAYEQTLKSERKVWKTAMPRHTSSMLARSSRV